MIVDTRYRLPEALKADLSLRTPNWGFGQFSEVIYNRTYSRAIDGRQERWHDTVIRAVEGEFSILRWHFKQSGVRWDEALWSYYARRTAELVFELKLLPPGRGLWAGGAEHVFKVGNAALNNPLHEDTQILTKEGGWQRIGDLAGQHVTVLSNTKLYGRDAETTTANAVWAEAAVSESETHPALRLVYRDPIGQDYEVIASENHRWFRKRNTKTQWERVTTPDLRVGDWLPMTRPPKYYAVSPQGVQHGFFFGDGTKANGELHAFHSEKIDLLRALFTNVEDVTDGHAVVRTCPLGWGGPPEGGFRSDRRYVYGFLAGYFAADGCVGANGEMTLSSANLDNLRQVRALFRELGVSTTAPKLVSTSSNYKDERSLYEIRIYPGHMQEDFFFRATHRERWEANRGRFTKCHVRVMSVTRIADPQRVLCATVPGYEQFVIDGFCLTSNCGFVDVRTLSSDAGWLMDHLMLGVGVGFSTNQWDGGLSSTGRASSRHTFVIPDSREGWVESVKLLIRSYEQSPGSAGVDFDYALIRPAGSPIRGFGGVASGPGPLIALHEKLRQRLDAYCDGGVARSELVADIMNLIGKCVVAGNVRRSAEIALGSPYDDAFLNLKNAERFPERNTYPAGWASLSNNSVVLASDADFEMLPDLVPGIIHNGEPGFINLQTIQKWGRLGKRKDDRAVGANPCSEIPLESYELCCLVEVFPTRCASTEEFFEALQLATLYASAISLLPSHDPRTRQVVDRNHRIGVSLSGLADWKDAIGVPRLTRLLRDGYKVVERMNETLMARVGLPPSVRLTTVKPSGTISQLAGVASGMHHPWDRWSLRRVRIGANTPLVPVLQAAGVPHEPDVTDPSNTLVFEFPIEFGGGHTRPQSEVSVWEQMAFVAMLQRDWADNMVSNTITFGPQEESQLAHVLGMFAPVIKSTSMLPDLDAYAKSRGEQPAYAQAPYEKITRDEHRRRSAAIRPIDWSRFEGSDGEDSKYCASDSCEV